MSSTPFRSRLASVCVVTVVQSFIFRNDENFSLSLHMCVFLFQMVLEFKIPEQVSVCMFTFFFYEIFIQTAIKFIKCSIMSGCLNIKKKKS